MIGEHAILHLSRRAFYANLCISDDFLLERGESLLAGTFHYIKYAAFGPIIQIQSEYFQWNPVILLPMFFVESDNFLNILLVDCLDFLPGWSLILGIFAGRCYSLANYCVHVPVGRIEQSILAPVYGGRHFKFVQK